MIAKQSALDMELPAHVSTSSDFIPTCHNKSHYRKVFAIRSGFICLLVNYRFASMDLDVDPNYGLLRSVAA